MREVGGRGGARDQLHCALPHPPLDLKINNQVIWVGREVAMEEVDASEGGKRRGGGEARAMEHDEGMSHRSCRPTPSIDLRVNNQLKGWAGRT